MRNQFLEVETRKEVKARAPWACKIIKVEGGFIAFASADDAKRWKQQK